MSEEYLEHHGILGMKWGVRRYQNKDGSLTAAGKRRYKTGESMDTKDPNDSAVTRRVKQDYNSMSNNQFRTKYYVDKEVYRKRVNKYGDPYKNGSLAKVGKELEKTREQTTSLTSADIKKIATAAVATYTVAASAYYIHKNPERIGKVMSQFKGVKVSELSKKAVTNGEKIVNEMIKSAREGVKEGLKDAPKKATKAVVTGVVLNQTKKALDSVVGKEASAKIFQANDNKKIGKFWKVSPDDKDDDD